MLAIADVLELRWSGNRQSRGATAPRGGGEQPKKQIRDVGVVGGTPCVQFLLRIFPTLPKNCDTWIEGFLIRVYPLARLG